MVANSHRHEVLHAVRKVLAADCACSEHVFLENGITVTHASQLPGRRRFPAQSKSLFIVSMGAGVVVSCSSDRMAWLRTNLGSLDRDTVFSAMTIARLVQFVDRDHQDLIGPQLKYVCSLDSFRPASTPEWAEISIVEENDIVNLYEYRGFDNALAYDSDHPRPDVLASVATRAGDIVGIAGASMDFETVWQVGVDVVEDARGLGIGRTLVGSLTDRILKMDRIPYYSTSVANIPSRALATGLGYWPAWVEIHAMDRR